MPHKDPEARRAYFAEYDAKRQEKTRLRKAKWRTENPEQNRTNHATWRARNPDKVLASRIKARAKLRQEVLDHYGGVCACCKEWRSSLLTVDHIDGGGNQHRKLIGSGSGYGFYSWLRSHGFPPGYQVLCWNCNCGRHLNGGICPHVTEPEPGQLRVVK